MKRAPLLKKPPSTPTSSQGSGKKGQSLMTSFFKSTTPQRAPLNSPPSPATPLGSTPSPLTIEDEEGDTSTVSTPIQASNGKRKPEGSSKKSAAFSTPKSVPRNGRNGKSGGASKANPRKRLKKESPENGEDEPIDDSDTDPDFTNVGPLPSETESEGETEVEEDEEDAEEDFEEDDICKTPTSRKKRSAPATNRSAKRPAFASATGPAKGRKNAKKSSKKAKIPVQDGEEEEDGEERNEDGDDDSGDGLVRQHTHETLSFLHPDKIRDKSGILHKQLLAEGLTPQTLKVPSDYITSATPALKQWWEIKADKFDSILFFKLGKFYEMYHMDADVAVKELDLAYMKGENAHCGFPEAAFSRFANKLVEKGHKVVRVEQMMTPAQFKLIEKKGKNALPREVIRVHTPGTMSINTLECETENKNCSNSDASCLLSICEKTASGSEHYEYGICLLYPGPGTFLVGQFVEDRYHSRLRTLLAQHTPNEIILERGHISPTLKKILQSNADQARKEYLLPVSEFYESRKAIDILLERQYFGDILAPQWPPTLAAMLELGGAVPTSKPGCELAFRALGACTWYLKRCEVDLDLISLKNFDLYRPADQPGSVAVELHKPVQPKHMVLDNVTLLNLDVVPSGKENSDSCLLRKINRCKTKFGARLLKEWILSPLYRIPDIVDRQAAIAHLSLFKKDHDKLHKDVLDHLKGLPDLERLLSKVHIVGSLQRKKCHPETRAVMFDDTIYSKRKIKDFLVTIQAFGNMLKIVAQTSEALSGANSRSLRQIVTLVSGAGPGAFPDLGPVLSTFLEAFDMKQAEADGLIKPKKGIDPEYDAAVAGVGQLENWFEKHRIAQGIKFHCEIKYVGSAKNRFQLEVPESVCGRMPSSYELKSARKGFKRYWSEEIRGQFAELEIAEARQEAAVKDCARRIFEKFDEHYADWMKAVRCVATLDVLMALEEYSSNLSPSCVPVFKEASPDVAPYIKIRDGHHPLVIRTFSTGEFIPNDAFIGTGEPNDASYNGSLTLVTGPNMGGKSTLMRQTGLITVLAQLGSNVPATFCELTPVDRIFTRIGASDNLLAGESTFFVELSETSRILQHATQNSLVLVDELGRGTATFDGTAVAAAVLKDLVTRIKCRTLFSTHYHSLVERFSAYPSVKLGHMACLVENENDSDPTQAAITFLYKFIRGACPKSYGFNAAKLAGLNDKIVKRAHEKAMELEKLMQLGKLAI